MSGQFAALKIAPGIFRPGTIYDAKNRWFDANLVRWYENAMRPVGGWEPLPSSEGNVNVGEPVREMLTSRANDGSLHLFFGTPERLWHFRMDQFAVEFPGFASDLVVTDDQPS